MALDPKMLRELYGILLTDIDQQGELLIDALLLLERADTAADARKSGYAAIMRVAHNLKGGAGSMGLTEVEKTFHLMETLFTQLQGNDASPTGDFVDGCRTVIARVRQAIADQLSGAPPSVDFSAVRDLLRPAMLATRDLAAQLGKRVEITLDGETAEIDRLAIERLRDPLNHLCATPSIMVSKRRTNASLSASPSAARSACRPRAAATPSSLKSPTTAAASMPRTWRRPLSPKA